MKSRSRLYVKPSVNKNPGHTLSTHYPSACFPRLLVLASTSTRLLCHPINHHGHQPRKAHSRAGKKWGADKLLDWIKEYRSNLVKVGQLEKLKAEDISGDVFLNHAGDVRFFQNECGLTAGARDRPANLARGIAEAGWETGMKSKLLSFMSCIPRRQQANNVTGNKQ